MSWQGYEAVLDHSQIGDATGRLIFSVVGSFTDATGTAGAGGKMTSPSIDKIAERAGCHRNTVLNWLQRIEATGELTIERMGKGRGAWNIYTINLPMSEESSTPNNGTNGTSKGGLKEEIAELKNAIKELVQMVQELRLMVQETVHNGTSQDVLDTEIQVDTDLSAEPKTRALSERQKVTAELEKFFAQKTGLPVPNRKTERQKKEASVRWWTPLWDMHKLTGNLEQTKSLITTAISDMKRPTRANPKGLTISAPQSIYNAFLDLYAGSTNGHHGHNEPHHMLEGV